VRLRGSGWARVRFRIREGICVKNVSMFW
jgi:hypothetical protein